MVATQVTYRIAFALRTLEVKDGKESFRSFKTLKGWLSNVKPLNVFNP
jgi:hypothetical protein